MGSFFLNDSYRMADDMALFKDSKPANYSSNGIFENNLCFKNIKRGLGFETQNDGSDDWTSRARASPVVERLIFEELRSDIVEYAGNIGINMDPREWCVEDTQKWLRWVGNLYHIGDLTNCLSYDGQTLCSFTEEEFILLTGTKDVGQKIAAQLDIWKNVTKITPSAGSYHFRQQQAMSQKIEREEANAKMLDTNCWKAPAPQQFPTSQETLPQNQFGSRGNNDSMVGGSRGNFPPNMRTGNLYPTYNGVNTESFPSDPPQERCTPRPTIPLDRFRSVRQSYQDNGYLPWEKYQEFTSFNRGPQGVMFSLATEKEGIAMTNTPGISGFQLDKIETKKEPGPPLSTVPMPATITSAMPAQMQTPDEGELTDLSNPMKNELQADFPELALLEPKTEKVVEPQEVSMDTLEAKVTIDKTTKKKSTKHPIHLWEFLKQLLHDGKDCIRWIDQEKGVFKIYNSQEVAKFWGERKNRPAMNYDKLSRSIRQYYKKGIIKKTSQGKRLVYQFCEGYL